MKIGIWRIIAGVVLLHSTAVAVPNRSEIWEAVEDGDLEKVQEIVQAWSRSPNDVSDPNGPCQGLTPLMLAIALGQDPVVDFMLQYGDANFLKAEPLRGDNVLLLAIRCSGYTRILNLFIAHLENLFRMSLARSTLQRQRKDLAEKLRKIFTYRNYDGENALDLIIRNNVINKAAILERLLTIGLKPTWVPLETSGIYEPGQLPTHPLYALYWQKEWEAFFVLDQHYPTLVFHSIEFPATKPFLRRFGHQSVITKILEPDTFPEFRAAASQYGTHSPFLQLVCGIPPTDRRRLPPAFVNTQSSDGYTPGEIFLRAMQTLETLDVPQEEISKLRARARAMGLPLP